MGRRPDYKNGRIGAWKNISKAGKEYIAVRASVFDVLNCLEQVKDNEGKNTDVVKFNLYENKDDVEQQEKKD